MSKYCIEINFQFDFQIRRKRLARLAGSEPPASPPEPPKEVVPADVVEEPAPMEEDIEGQKASVTRSQSSVRILMMFISGNVLLWPQFFSLDETLILCLVSTSSNKYTHYKLYKQHMIRKTS